VVSAPRRPGAAITVVDPFGAPLKVPAWMFDPDAHCTLSQTAAINARALLDLCELLRKQ
jgi:hypothetical protein